MKDRFDREINYMRISVTDRCNLRCEYCMPEEGITKVDRSEILQIDEIVRICEASVRIGIDRFKITGGEPLVRYDLVELIRMIKGIPGCKEVTMTSNGQILGSRVEELADIGIDGINISLDTLDAEKYRKITRLGDIRKTLDAIDLCIEKVIKTKINCLVQKGFNEDEIRDLAEYSMDKGIDIRYIELMPIGFADPDKCLGSEEIMSILRDAYPELEADDSKHGNGPAIYYKVPGRNSSIGFINSVHGKFCESCNRIRLTSKGFLKPCLCYDSGRDLKPFLRSGIDGLVGAIFDTITEKPKAHCFESPDREHIKSLEKRPMSEIGG